MNNEEKNSYSQKLEIMKQYYQQQLEVNQENIQKRNQQDNFLAQQEQEQQNYVQSNQNGISEYQEKDSLNDVNINGLSYMQLKEQIQEAQIQFDNKKISKSTNMLEKILIQSQVNLQKEQQKLLYVEVLMLCNNYAKYYLQYQEEIQNAYLLLQKCDLWSQTYDFEPLMRVLTMINLGYYFRQLRKNILSLDMFKEALKITLEKKYYSKLAEIYFNLAQLNNLIGQHEKSQEYASKALQQCQRDFMDVNSPDIPISRMPQDQILLMNEKNLQNDLQKCQSLDSKYSTAEYSNIQKNNQNWQTTNEQLSTEQNECYSNQLNEDLQNLQNQSISNQSSIEQNEQAPDIQNKYQSNMQINNQENFENEYPQMIQNEQIQSDQGDIQKLNNGLQEIDYKLEWGDNKILNLINCYQVLAKLEEKLLHFDEANRLYTKAVSIAQDNMGLDHQISETQLNKLIAFQQRLQEQEQKQNKFQNKKNKFSHHVIKPLLQQYLNEKSIKFNQNAIQKLQLKRAEDFNGLHIQKKDQQSSPYTQKILTSHQQTQRLKSSCRTGNSEATNHNKVIQIRQKKLNLDTVPSSLKFNATNCTVPTQNSIVSSSTATTKNLYNTQKDLSPFHKIKIRERKSSFCEGNNQQKESNETIKNSSQKQSSKQCQTSRDQHSPDNIQIRERLKRSTSTSFQNDVFSAYPSPRLRSQKGLYIPLKQKNTEPDSLNLVNSENIKALIENQIAYQKPISKMPTQKQAIFQINFNKNIQKQPIIAQPYLQSPKNSLINSKSHLQTFVNQMNIQRNQVSLQFQEIDTQIQSNSQQQQSKLQTQPQAQMLEDNIGQQKTIKSPRKILIYSDIKRKIKEATTNQNNLSDRIQISMNHVRQKAMSQYDQPQYLQNTEQNLVSENQQQYIEQHLQNQNQIELIDSLFQVQPISNQSHNIIEREKLFQYQKRKSLSEHIRCNTDGGSYKCYIDRSNDNEQELLYEVKQCSIKIIDSEQENQSNQYSTIGNTQFLFNKQLMMIQIQFTQNKNSYQQEQDSNNLNQQLSVLNHSLNISDIFTLFSPDSLNVSIILTRLCSKIYQYLEIDNKNKQLIIKQSSQQQLQSQKNDQPGIQIVIDTPKTIESIHDSIIFHLVQKDYKSSIIYCQENTQTQNENSEKASSNSQAYQGETSQSQINSPISLYKPPNMSYNPNEGQFISIIIQQGNQINKQAVFSYISKGNSKDQQSIIGKQTEQVKQNYLKFQKDSQLKRIKQNQNQFQQQYQQSLSLQQQSQQLQQKLKQQQLLSFQRNFHTKSNSNTDDINVQPIDIETYKKQLTQNQDSKIKLQIKQHSQSPIIRKSCKDNILHKQNTKPSNS